MAIIREAIGKRLVATRRALGLSAADLCRRIDCKPNRWSQYETGERQITLEIANRLCEEFRLSLDWIYRGDPSALSHSLASVVSIGHAGNRWGIGDKFRRPQRAPPRAE
jgi:transcriptional regulator with XRE-family HTH domain